MKTCLIKVVSRPGEDPKRFRAYHDAGDGLALVSLKVMSSTTGNEDMGAIRCAGKAFLIDQGKKPSDTGINAIEKRITLARLGDGLYRATLNQELKPKTN